MEGEYRGGVGEGGKDELTAEHFKALNIHLVDKMVSVCLAGYCVFVFGKILKRVLKLKSKNIP
jgi:hypothetical protein